MVNWHTRPNKIALRFVPILPSCSSGILYAVFVRITNEAAITTKRAGKKISDLDATDSGLGSGL